MRIPMRFYYNLGVSTAPLRFLSFLPKYRIVAESSSLNIDYICLKITDNKKKNRLCTFLKMVTLKK